MNYLVFVHQVFGINVLLYRIIKFPRPSLDEVCTQLTYLHCGVLDYSSDKEECCYLPPWMMRQLNLKDGDPAWFQYISANLPDGTFVKFKPLLLKRVLNSINTGNIKAMRTLMEGQLKKYQCLTVGDEIDINVGVNNDEIRFRVVSLLPLHVVNITNCDLKVDFDDYYLLTETAIFDEHKLEPVIDVDYKPGQLCFIRRQGYLTNKLVKELDNKNNKTRSRTTKPGK
ncbi:hypothetical protein Mgra_00003641 [Meloidogyne graminicola]|uniref:Uncharacterized protein n=1 Tax=Meloidogyne graminicola TaxID=189291 RepID=A0A8S9ZV87_9BILA|nr:hypothetical protein Mgra_00003641 [Meloidogyne graminicola]